MRNGSFNESGFPENSLPFDLKTFLLAAGSSYVNTLFVNSPEKFRQYGLWDRYTDVHPESDQTSTIGISDPKKGLVLCSCRQVFFLLLLNLSSRVADKYIPSTWTFKFLLNSIKDGIYELRLAIASATRSDLQVYLNDMDQEHMVFQVMNLGEENAVCRHGIHGL
ncbi:hypothetical protein NC653_026859 [Populus alba x Populus x berolinensis]|uniref:Rhamnogalacturonan lyase domain-containing protein n=1 Tax=Populus alba x Populus x berolinensis TaxID=444605 RepID=A0AAD6Q5F3_9ROSI|nr:hypothetical protein NC653_026859 [Populus alba x Populus x berolinensis]